MTVLVASSSARPPSLFNPGLLSTPLRPPSLRNQRSACYHERHARDKLRSLLIRAASFGRSSSMTATKCSPTPLSGFACRTAASALICPSGTRKVSWLTAPMDLGLAVSINRPPVLMFRTRETASRPSHCHNTHTSSGSSILEVNLREGVVFCHTLWPPKLRHRGVLLNNSARLLEVV